MFIPTEEDLKDLKEMDEAGWHRFWLDLRDAGWHWIVMFVLAVVGGIANILEQVS